MSLQPLNSLTPFPQNTVINPTEPTRHVGLPMDPQWIAWFNQVQATLGILATVFVTVQQFGAKGDGVTDDGPAFQAAINSVSAAGGGMVLVPIAFYYFGTNSTLTIPANVQLSGTVIGPFEGSSQYGSGPWAPTLLVNSTAGVFITMNGFNAKVMNLLFYYPNQVSPTATTPTVYPATIYMYGGEGFACQLVKGCTFINSYSCIYANGCIRSMIQDCHISGFSVGITVDEMVDWFIIQGCMFQAYWDEYVNLAWPQNIDNWVLTNASCIVTYRADAMIVSDCGMFARYNWHLATDSPNTTQPHPLNSYGVMNNIDVDTCTYGVIAVSTNSPGWTYTNMNVGANNTGHGTAAQAVATISAGGAAAPTLYFNGGQIRGSWAYSTVCPYNFSAAGQIYTEAVRGMMPVGAISSPAFPATTVSYKNPYTFPIQITYNATMTGTPVLAGGGIYTNNIGTIILPVGKSISFTYSGTGNWTFTGL